MPVTRNCGWMWIAGGAAFAAATLALTGCGGNSSSGPGPQSPSAVSMGLDGGTSQITLASGQPAQAVFTVQMPSGAGHIESATLDIASTLKRHGTIASAAMPRLAARVAGSRLGLGDLPSATAYIHVGTDPATVCEEGIVYGPFVATYSESLEVNPPTATANAGTVQIMNSGPMVICLTVTPNFNGAFDIDSLEAEVSQSDCGAPGNFEGTWSGTYTCGNSCGKPFGGEVMLVVSQDGTTASYVDGSDDTYHGTICGNTFRFERNDPGESERGIMTLDDANHATKRSTWHGTEGTCHGDCLDHLTRVSE